MTNCILIAPHQSEKFYPKESLGGGYFHRLNAIDKCRGDLGAGKCDYQASVKDINQHDGQHVGHHNVISTLCEDSERLLEWKSESITNGLTDDGCTGC